MSASNIGREPLPAETRALLVTVVAGALAPTLDTTIVTIAQQRLVTDLGAGLDTVQWVVSVYFLAYVVVVPTVGWLDRRLGGHRLWIAALALFGLASVLCGLAWDPLSLIAFRFVQGLAAGVLVTLLQVLPMRAAGGVSRARIAAAMSLPIGLAPLFGPLVGGLVLTWASWRWMFLVNVPLVAYALFRAVRRLPADDAASGPAPRPDFLGLAALAPGLGLVFWAVTALGESGAGWQVWGALAAGVVLLAAFVLRSARPGGRPLVDLTLLRTRAVGAGSALMLVLGAALFGSTFLLPLYWQLERGSTVLAAALLVSPQAVTSLLVRGVVGRITDRVGARVTAAVAFALVAVTTVPFALAGPHTPIWWLAAVLAVRGLGFGALMVPVLSSLYIGLDAARVSDASMLGRIAQQLGGALGVTLLATVLHAAGRGASSVEPGMTAAFWVVTVLSLAGAAAAPTLATERSATAATTG